VNKGRRCLLARRAPLFRVLGLFDRHTSSLTHGSPLPPPPSLTLRECPPPSSSTGIVIFDVSDPAGLPLTAVLQTLPATGTLYECDASDTVLAEITEDQLPHATHGIRLKFKPDLNDVSINKFTYIATNEHGLESAPSEALILIFEVENLPTAGEQAATQTGSNLDLSIAVSDPDSPFVSIFVDTLPERGALYYSADAFTSQLMEPFVDNFISLLIEQYGHEVLEFSTFWPGKRHKHTRAHR